MKNLHQNHYFLMDVRLALVQMIGKSSDGSKTEESEKELVLKQKLCLELLNVFDIICPGNVYYQVHATFCILVKSC